MGSNILYAEREEEVDGASFGCDGHDHLSSRGHVRGGFGGEQAATQATK